MTAKELSGKITISRCTSNGPYHPVAGIRITVEDDLSSTTAIECELTAEEFGMAITGCGFRPCTFRMVSAVGVGREGG